MLQMMTFLSFPAPFPACNMLLPTMPVPMFIQVPAGMPVQQTIVQAQPLHTHLLVQLPALATALTM
jgi:hypothetical protein